MRKKSVSFPTLGEGHKYTVDYSFSDTKDYIPLQAADVEINGRKFFWHHRPNLNARNEKTDLNSTIHPITEGSEKRNCFTFDIYFDHISEKELNLLAFSADLGGSARHFHKIGYAKPLGFGSAEVKVDGIELRRLSVDEESLYSMEAWTKRNKDINSIDGVNKKTVDQLLVITDFDAVASEIVAYPFTDYSDDGFQWFADNNGKRPAVLPPMIENADAVSSIRMDTDPEAMEPGKGHRDAENKEPLTNNMDEATANLMAAMSSRYDRHEHGRNKKGKKR